MGSRVVELTLSADRQRGNYDPFPDLWEEDAHRYARLTIGRSDALSDARIFLREAAFGAVRPG
jgi:hypothetical protein